MMNIRLFAVLFALICVFSLTAYADDSYVGDWDDLSPSTTEPETTTEEPGEDTTEPEESVSEDATTAPAENESTEQPSEQETQEPTSESVTTETEEQVTAGQTTAPVGEQTTDDGLGDDNGGLPIPLPVILVVLAVLGIGGVVACVFILKKYAVK